MADPRMYCVVWSFRIEVAPSERAARPRVTLWLVTLRSGARGWWQWPRYASQRPAMPPLSRGSLLSLLQKPNGHRPQCPPKAPMSSWPSSQCACDPGLDKLWLGFGNARLDERRAGRKPKVTIPSE